MVVFGTGIIATVPRESARKELPSAGAPGRGHGRASEVATSVAV